MSLTCSFQSLILPSSLNETDGTASSPLGLLLARQTKLINTCAVRDFVTDLYPASLMHKSPQRRKIIHNMHMTQRSIDQSEHLFVEIFCFVISVAEICDFVISGSCIPDA